MAERSDNLTGPSADDYKRFIAERKAKEAEPERCPKCGRVKDANGWDDDNKCCEVGSKDCLSVQISNLAAVTAENARIVDCLDRANTATANLYRENKAVTAERDKFKGLLARVIEGDSSECNIVRGFCQTHDCSEPCIIAEIRAALEGAK